ncbi:uncharacterized protein LOC111519520 [Drosophila willistoni]|uniref:uncharacterized protein LOC111519520 n=1 Tax=Drosophila willistoni TaxID=7260 RepID=UPI000C26D558|nr:uncharacterized protein LOC111519520 [Drosophila willistoni]
MTPLHTVELPDTQFVEEDPRKPLSYQVQITNATVYGFENTTITKVKSDVKQKKVELYGRIPSLVGKTRSSVHARIIAGYYNASGQAIAELQNFRFIIKAYLVVTNRRFLKLYKVFVNTKIDRAIFDVTDVHTYNSDFAIVVNQWMNENWQEIWTEFEPIIKSVISEYFIEYVNNKLTSLQARYDDFFLPENE